MKKRKIKKWIHKHKAAVISIGSFAITGLLGLLIGFEIANDWHAIRKWLASPYAATFFIALVLGLFALALVIYALISARKGND